MEIVLALVMAVTVEALIEYGKEIARCFQGGDKKTALTYVGSTVLAVLLCFAVGTDVYAAMGVTFAVPWVGTLLTGIFASRGSNYVSDLVSKLHGMLAQKAE